MPAAQQSPVPHPDRPSRRVRPWIGPLISAALLAALLAIAATLPANQARGGYSQAGAWIRQHLLPPDRTFPAITTNLDLYFVREPTGLRLIDTDAESADDITRLLMERPGDVLLLRYQPRIVRQGLWAITEQADHHRIVAEFGSNFTPAEREEALRRFIAYAAAVMPHVSDEVFTALARGETINRHTTIASGWVVNITTLALLGAFLLSLRWVFRVPGQVRAWRGRRALAAGRCPACGYSIQDLESSICPECGRAFR